MTGHRTMFLVNPHADLGRVGRIADGFRPEVEQFGGAHWVTTDYPAHATELSRQAGEQGYQLVIAAGGDGTVHEVINGLMQVPAAQRPHLGIVPLGSGNDFAHTVGISNSPAEAIKQAFTGKPAPIDLGRFDLGDGTIGYFDNTFGMGFDATVTIRSRKLTMVRGFMMYLVAVLQTIALNHASPTMRIETDQGNWEEPTIMFVVCNGPREGGGFLVAPQSIYNDGVLNYASVRHVSRLMMLRLIPEVMNGTHGRYKQVRLGQLHRLHLHSQKPLTIHADGEVISGFDTKIQDVNVEIIPAAVQLNT